MDLFIMECHRLITEAQSIVDFLPNAETPAVARVTHQLDVIRDILTGLYDSYLHGGDLELPITYVFSVLGRLDTVIAQPSFPARPHSPPTSGWFWTSNI
jgi:hypothetical protein